MELLLPNVEKYVYTGTPAERNQGRMGALEVDTLNHIYIKTSGLINHALAPSRHDMGLWIRELERSEKVQQMINAFHAPAGGYIGVHVENSLDAMALYSSNEISDAERKLKEDAIKTSTTAVFISEMQRIIDDDDPHAKFFLSTDSARVSEDIRAHFDGKSTTKKRIVYLESRGDCYDQSSVICAEFAFCEMMLLGNAKRVLSSGNFNAFSDIASLKAGKRALVAGFAFPKLNEAGRNSEIRERMLEIDL